MLAKASSLSLSSFSLSFFPCVFILSLSLCPPLVLYFSSSNSLCEGHCVISFLSPSHCPKHTNNICCWYWRCSFINTCRDEECVFKFLEAAASVVYIYIYIYREREIQIKILYHLLHDCKVTSGKYGSKLRKLRKASLTMVAPFEPWGFGVKPPWALWADL